MWRVAVREGVAAYEAYVSFLEGRQRRWIVLVKWEPVHVELPTCSPELYRVEAPDADGSSFILYSLCFAS